MIHVAWVLYFVVWAVVIGIVWSMCRAAAKPTPIGAWAFVMAFFHLGQRKDSSAEMDQKLLDSINKSRESWVAKPQTCTRRAPHECAVNGPCNGFPRRGTYAEGRPTMPSEVEPELERERRTR